MSEYSQNKDVVHQAKFCQLLIVGKAHKFLQLKVFILEKLRSYSDCGEGIRVCRMHAEVPDRTEGLLDLIGSMLEKCVRVLVLHLFVILIVDEQIIVKFIEI